MGASSHIREGDHSGCGGCSLSAEPLKTKQASRSRAWLELARVSNLPTVFTNVLTGCAIGLNEPIGIHISVFPSANAFPWVVAVTTFAAIAMHYTAGMILNDVQDVRIDAIERPTRPIPSGRVNRTTATLVAMMLFLIGLAVLWFQSPLAMLAGQLLVVFIIAYDMLHTKSSGTVMLLGLCRAMVYIIAALVINQSPPLVPLLAFSAALAAYVIVLSLIARSEATKPSRRRIVIRLLQGISMVDAVFLLLLGQTLAAVVAVAAYLLTMFLHKRIAGT